MEVSTMTERAKRRYFKNDEADINHLMNNGIFTTPILENNVLYSALHGMIAAGMHFKGDVKVWHSGKVNFADDSTVEVDRTNNVDTHSYLAFYEESDYQLFKSVLNAMEDDQ